MSDLVDPLLGLSIEVLKRGEGPGGKERFANVAYGTLDTSFLVSTGQVAGSGGEVIVSRQFEQPRMKADGIAAALEHHTFQIVVEQGSGAALPGAKGPNMPAQEVLQPLIEEKLQVERAGIRQGQHQSGEFAPGPADRDFSEAGPVDLSLFAREGAQSQEDLAGIGAQGGHQAAHADDASRVPTDANHLEEASRSQSGILLQRLTEERLVGVGQARASGLALPAPLEAVAADGSAHRVMVQVELVGNGSDLPVFGIEKTANPGHQLGVDHRSPPVKRVDEAAGAATADTNGSGGGPEITKSSHMTFLPLSDG